MRIHYFVVLVTLFISSFSFAKEVTVTKAEQFAKQFYTSFPTSTRIGEELSCELVYSANSSTRSDISTAPAFFIFNVNDGFVIVAGDDISAPVLGYSEKTNFEAQNMPANLRYWLNLYQKDIEAYREDINYKSLPPHESWDKPQNLLPTRNNDEILLTTAKWDQMLPYNQLCPKIQSVSTPTGCVATAFAIAMKYHQWPDKGVGSYSYSWLGKPIAITLGESYAWSNMPLIYNSGQYTSEQGKAVALLMYHCGVLANMNYSKEESGAFTIDAITGIAHHMKYNKGVKELYREWYDDVTWINMLKSELALMRPVVYGGSGTIGGHQFVFDGYRGDYFHVNWGWSGNSDGYYLITNLNPPALGTGGGAGGFIDGQSAVFDMYKDANGTSAYNDILAFFSSENNGVLFSGITTDKTIFKQGDKVDLTIGFIANYGIRNFNGIVRIEHCDKLGNTKSVLSGNYTISDLKQFYGTAFTDQITIGQSIASGDRILLKYKSADSNQWKKVMGGKDVTSELMIDAATSIESQTIEDDVIFVNDEIGVTIDAKNPITNIQLYNANGAIILQQALHSNNHTLYLNELYKGIYILRVTTATGVSTHKFTR